MTFLILIFRHIIYSHPSKTISVLSSHTNFFCHSTSSLSFCIYLHHPTHQLSSIYHFPSTSSYPDPSQLWISSKTTQNSPPVFQTPNIFRESQGKGPSILCNPIIRTRYVPVLTQNMDELWVPFRIYFEALFPRRRNLRHGTWCRRIQFSISISGYVALSSLW